MSGQNWDCDCGWSGHDDELRAECTFHGSREEPAEYDAYCPSCGNNADQMSEAIMCSACEDVQVKSDGDYCSECTQCMLEDKAEARRDDMMIR